MVPLNLGPQVSPTITTAADPSTTSAGTVVATAPAASGTTAESKGGFDSAVDVHKHGPQWPNQPSSQGCLFWPPTPTSIPTFRFGRPRPDAQLDQSNVPFELADLRFPPITNTKITIVRSSLSTQDPKPTALQQPQPIVTTAIDQTTAQPPPTTVATQPAVVATAVQVSRPNMPVTGKQSIAVMASLASAGQRQQHCFEQNFR